MNFQRLFNITILSFLLFLFVFSFEIYGSSHNAKDTYLCGTKSGYYLYAGNWGGGEVYVIDTDSYSFVDTIGGFDDYVSSLAVTQEGRQLYVSTRNGPANSPGKVYSVDTRTKERLLILNEFGDIYVSPNGTIFVIASGKVGIIDPMSDVVSFIDSLDIVDRGYANNQYNVVFDKNSAMMFGITNENQVFVYDYRELEVIRTFNIPFVPLHMVLSPDGESLYFTGAPDVFVVFNVEKDSVTAVFGMNQLGSVAISPDSRYVYITDPGGYLIPEPVPSGKIYVFDTYTNTPLEDIDIGKALGDYGVITDQIIITPEGRFAFVANWMDKVIVVDLDKREIVKVVQFDTTMTQIVPMALALKAWAGIPPDIGCSSDTPEEFILFQNFPNPFNLQTNIEYQIPDLESPVHITLKIYNVLGQEMKTLVNEWKVTSFYFTRWDGRNSEGHIIDSGFYFYQLRAGNFRDTKKMLFLK